MILCLTNSQMTLVESALEFYVLELKKGIEKKELAAHLASENLFQAELLIIWFEKQRELRS